MSLTPIQISGATFRTSRKGYDPDEVDAFLGEAARALEAAQQQATAMEARARAAVARLQEATNGQPEPDPAASTESSRVSPDDAETISRTLLLAQRTADAAIADARAEAERLVAEAREAASRALDEAQEKSSELVSQARADARRASESERQAAVNEVEALLARREFLVGDVDQLEQFLVDQRERLRGAARQIEALCERVPSGLGGVRPPALSAADDVDETAAAGSAIEDDTAELAVPPTVDRGFAGIEELADAVQDDETPVEIGDLTLPIDHLDGGEASAD